MTPGEAVEIVAAHIAAEVLDAYVSLRRHPELSDQDWSAVADHIEGLIPDEFTRPSVDAAYALLAERAEEVS